MTASFLFDGGFQWMTIASVIMLASGTIAHLFFSKSAVWRYQIWLNVLIAIFLLPLITLFIRSMDWKWTLAWHLTAQTLTTQNAPNTTPTPNDPMLKFRPELKASTTQNTIRETDTPPTTSITQSSPYSQNESFQQEWMQPGKTVLLWIWSLGSLFALAKWIFGLRKINRILQITEPATNQVILDTLHRTTDGIQMNRTPIVRLSDQITTPMVVGTWNPSILLPIKQIHEVTESELEQILIHECAHIQRGDHRIWFLQQIGKILFWINPLYHWLQTELNRAREELCDNHVLQQWTGLDYAQTLSKVSNKWHQHEPMINVLAIGFRKHQLLHRVETLLDQTADHRSALNPISQSASGILFSALILSCTLFTAGLTQERTKDSTIETSKLRPYPNEIKPQKYLMSDGKDIHEVEYYPWVEESDYQRVPKSLLEIRQIPTFKWPSSKQPRIQVSARFARNMGLTYNQVTDLNTATTQAIHDYNMLKAHHLKFTYHSKKEKKHNGATIVENVNFEWYPKKSGLIYSFRKIRKRLETQVRVDSN